MRTSHRIKGAFRVNNGINEFFFNIVFKCLGQVTVRHQGSLDVCWTFASLASLESTLKPTVTADLSENHVRWYHGFDSGPVSGGNADMVLAYLARWNGPVNESSDPYNSGPKTGLTPVYHVQQAEYLPDKSAAAIKQALIDSGAVYTSIYASAVDSSTYYNDQAAALYYNGSAPLSTRRGDCRLG